MFTSMKRCVYSEKHNGDLEPAVRRGLEFCGLLPAIGSSTRVAIKPNFTYPYHKSGITTPPGAIRALVHILKERTDRIAIVETDGGYGAWRAEEAFAGHGVFDLAREYGIEAVNLCLEPRDLIDFASRWGTRQVPLPQRLLRDTDILVSMPVPKVHAMTRLTLSYKNQWGCIPDVMRLRRHHIFNDAIVAINRRLRPVVVADGTWFLDKSGPMDGVPIDMGLVITATYAGAFDRYVSELMGVHYLKVPHLRRAVALGDMPATLAEVRCNVPPRSDCKHTFSLERTPRNWIALGGFNSRFLTWLGYESWFGRVILHAILYAIVGRPVKPRTTR